VVVGGLIPMGIVVRCCLPTMLSSFHSPFPPQAVAWWGWGQVVHCLVQGLFVLLVAPKRRKKNKKLTYGPGDITDVSWALIPASLSFPSRHP